MNGLDSGEDAVKMESDAMCHFSDYLYPPIKRERHDSDVMAQWEHANTPEMDCQSAEPVKTFSKAKIQELIRQEILAVVKQTDNKMDELIKRVQKIDSVSKYEAVIARLQADVRKIKRREQVALAYVRKMRSAPTAGHDQRTPSAAADPKPSTVMVSPVCVSDRASPAKPGGAVPTAVEGRATGSPSVAPFSRTEDKGDTRGMANQDGTPASGKNSEVDFCGVRLPKRRIVKGFLQKQVKRKQMVEPTKEGDTTAESGYDTICNSDAAGTDHSQTQDSGETSECAVTTQTASPADTVPSKAACSVLTAPHSTTVCNGEAAGAARSQTQDSLETMEPALAVGTASPPSTVPGRMSEPARLQNEGRSEAVTNASQNPVLSRRPAPARTLPASTSSLAASTKSRTTPEAGAATTRPRIDSWQPGSDPSPAPSTVGVTPTSRRATAAKRPSPAGPLRQTKKQARRASERRLALKGAPSPRAPLSPSPPRLHPGHQAPQKLELKVARIRTRGAEAAGAEAIGVLWSVGSVDPQAAPPHSYHLYAIQEDPDGTFSPWRSLGAIKPMRLPMGCKLTDYGPGKRFCFTVVARDSQGRYGPYSDIQSINPDNT